MWTFCSRSSFVAAPMWRQSISEVSSEVVGELNGATLRLSWFLTLRSIWRERLRPVIGKRWMDRDAGREKRVGPEGGVEVRTATNHKWIFCLSPSLHPSPLSHLSVLFPSSAFPLSLSARRRGWRRSMSSLSRTWSSCCWATRWDLAANTGTQMDSWRREEVWDVQVLYYG